jgi:hypothetical protein
MGQKWRRRAGLAAQGGAGRWSLCSGEGSGVAGTQAARGARVVQGGRDRGFGLLWGHAGDGAQQWRKNGMRRRALGGKDGGRTRGRLGGLK